MPWKIAKGEAGCPPGKPWAVVKESDGSVEGCHATEAEAEAQQRALYASEPAASATLRDMAECSCRTEGRGDSLHRQVPNPPRAAAATEAFDTPFPVPEYPPSEWFAGPPDWVEGWRSDHGLGPSRDASTGILKLTVTDEGRVGGWFYEAGSCIIHQHEACPGPSPTRYAAFHQQDVILDDGTAMQVGVIGNVHGHASPWVDYVQAQAHYADPSAQMILCRAGDDERGGWIAGCVVPGLSFGEVALLRRSGLSGDWRPMPASWWKDHGVTAAAVRESEGYDCVGPTLVTRPALPLVKSFAASLGNARPVILGGAAGIQLEDDPELVVGRVEEVRMASTRVSLPDGTVVESFGPGDGLNGVSGTSAGSTIEGLVAAASTDMPIAERDRAWDGSGAKSRIAKMASSDGSGDKDKINWGTYGRAFLYHDAEKGQEFGAYKLPFADVINGKLQIVPKGVSAAAGALRGARGGVDIPASAKDTIKGRIGGLYSKMRKKFGDDNMKPPWQAAVSGAADLPLASEGTPWDPVAAQERLRSLASPDGTGEVATLDWSMIDQAFFYRDDMETDTSDPFAAYKLPFADVIDGKITAVPDGVAAAAAEVDSLGLPDEDVAAIKAAISAYQGQSGEAPGETPPAEPQEEPMADETRTAAGNESVPTGDQMGGEAMAPSEPDTPEQPDDIQALSQRVDDLEGRLAALEEHISAQMEAQVAALIEADKPLPEPAEA